MTTASEDTKPYITTSQGMVHYYAVHIWWNPEGFLEPYNTGIGRYRTKEEAVAEAKAWAEAEGLPYKD